MKFTKAQKADAVEMFHSEGVATTAAHYACSRQSVYNWVREGVGAGRSDLTGANHRGINDPANHQMSRVDSTLGWSDCGHDNWRPALILDPFAGSGTTGLVATGYGHDAILIDLDERNAELAMERVGPFLMDVEA